jgi:hypothetical protein
VYSHVFRRQNSNREALEEFGKRIDALRERLADYLKPQHIMKTLTGLNGLALLPQASERGTDEL